MSYGEKYFTNFYDNDNNKFRLQIFEWGFTSSASDNIQLADNPVVITYSQDDDYFQPIIGSNCKLRLFVEDNTGGDHWEDEQTHWDLADFFWERTGFDFLNPVNDREFKVVINSTLTHLGNLFMKSNLTDMETCYKVFRGEILRSIPIEENRFGFEPEITAKISKLRPRLRIYEVGISYYGRTYEEGKKITWKDGFRALYSIIKYNLFR